MLIDVNATSVKGVLGDALAHVVAHFVKHVGVGCGLDPHFGDPSRSRQVASRRVAALITLRGISLHLISQRRVFIWILARWVLDLFAETDARFGGGNSKPAGLIS